jgi:hypothetical protein
MEQSVILFAEFVLSLETGYGMTGDNLYLTSPYHKFTQPSAVSFWLRNKQQQNFTTYIVWEDSSWTPVNTIIGETNYAYFQRHSFCMPTGNFGLAFKVTLDQIMAYELSINDVHISNSIDCAVAGTGFQCITWLKQLAFVFSSSRCHGDVSLFGQN